MKTKLINGLSEIYNKYDTFLIDLWGVIHNGIKPYPEALEVLKNLKKVNKKFIFISNAPRPSINVKNFLIKLKMDTTVEGLYSSLTDATLLTKQAKIR